MTTPRPAGATVADTTFAGRVAAWAAHHRRTSGESLGAMLRSPVSSAMTWLVIGIALALPTILYLVLVNVSAVSGDWDGRPRFSAYLASTVSATDAAAFARELRAMPGYASVTLITPEQALVLFKERSGFGDILDALPRNPLPSVIEIEPRTTDVAELRLAVSQLSRDPRIDTVVFDLEWIRRLFALIEFGERLVAALAAVLGLGVILVIGNTVRLAIESRRSEIEIVKLVGGTDAFVRRPFLYLGLWFGLGGAIAALMLIQASLVFLSYPVEALAQSYRDQFSLLGLRGVEVVGLLLAGAALGVTGAFVAVGRHLATIEPS